MRVRVRDRARIEVTNRRESLDLSTGSENFGNSFRHFDSVLGHKLFKFWTC